MGSQMQHGISGMQRVGVDFGLLMARAMLGVVFVFHGAQKLFGWFDGGGFSATVEGFGNLGMPVPTLSAAAAGGAEFFGGIALIVGLLTRLVSIPVAFTMFVAAFAVHGGAFSARAGGMEFPLTLGVMTFALVFTGPGRLAIDAAIFGRKKSRVSTGDAATSTTA